MQILFQVSWIRKTRPPVVLSYGGMAFTSDRRVSIEGPTRLRPHSWLLNINPILAKDHGLYECQVNTRGKMSLVYKLNVARKFLFEFIKLSSKADVQDFQKVKSSTVFKIS